MKICVGITSPVKDKHIPYKLLSVHTCLRQKNTIYFLEEKSHKYDDNARFYGAIIQKSRYIPQLRLFSGNIYGSNFSSCN